MLRQAVVSSGQQVLRSFKPKIQATKPRDTAKMVADGVVVGLRGEARLALAACALSVLCCDRCGSP